MLGGQDTWGCKLCVPDFSLASLPPDVILVANRRVVSSGLWLLLVTSTESQEVRSLCAHTQVTTAPNAISTWAESGAPCQTRARAQVVISHQHIQSHDGAVCWLQTGVWESSQPTLTDLWFSCYHFPNLPCTGLILENSSFKCTST